MCFICMQVDAEQFDKIMSYIRAGKEAGATLKHGAQLGFQVFIPRHCLWLVASTSASRPALRLGECVRELLGTC